jgi:multidrug transporter EmrE-like cation transporter
MELFPLSLVLLGSVFHLGWNVLAKGARDKLAFLWLALLVPAPFGLALSIWAGGFTPLTLGCVAASSAIHALYFWSLGKSYDDVDLSYVYPFTRGLGAVTATVLGVAFLAERPAPLGWLGISLALAATLFEPLTEFRGKGKLSRRGALMTALTGLCVGAYLFVDKVGVDSSTPLVYLGALFVGTPLCMAPFALKNGRAFAELKHSRLRPFWSAVFMSAAYGVIITAMKLAPISYVVSARASGIVVSGIAGIFFFGETVSKKRWGAIAAITLGVICLSLA